MDDHRALAVAGEDDLRRGRAILSEADGTGNVVRSGSRHGAPASVDGGVVDTLDSDVAGAQLVLHRFDEFGTDAIADVAGLGGAAGVEESVFWCSWSVGGIQKVIDGLTAANVVLEVTVSVSGCGTSVDGHWDRRSEQRCHQGDQ